MSVPEDPIDERVLRWVGILYRGMRSTGEQGDEEMTFFDARLLEQLRQDETDIDALMSSILTYLARMWLTPPDVFVADANARMGTTYTVDARIAAMRFELG
jgi:hypothetical protein